MLSLQIKSVINATAFINKNQSGNKPWLVSWKVHRNWQLHVSFLLHVPSLGGFKGFRKLSLCSGLVLIGNIKQYKPVNKQALGSGKWESKSILAFIRLYKAVCRAYKTMSLSKLSREQWEIYGGKKWGKYIYLGGGKCCTVKNCQKIILCKDEFFPLPNLLALAFWGSLSIAFPSLVPMCWASSADLCPTLMPEKLFRHRFMAPLWIPKRMTGAHGLQQSQDPSGKYKCRQIWLWVSSQLADTQKCLSLSLSLSLGSAQTVSFHSKSISCFCFQGLCMVLFFVALLIPSAALIFPRSVSHPKNSSVPIKLTELIWQGSWP